MTNGSSFEWMQTSIFGNAWLALADNVKCKFTNGIEGIIRELIPYIPLYLLMLAYDPDEDHRPAVYAAQQIAALLYVECTPLGGRKRQLENCRK